MAGSPELHLAFLSQLASSNTVPMVGVLWFWLHMSWCLVLSVEIIRHNTLPIKLRKPRVRTEKHQQQRNYFLLTFSVLTYFLETSQFHWIGNRTWKLKINSNLSCSHIKLEWFRGIVHSFCPLSDLPGDYREALVNFLRPWSWRAASPCFTS